MALCSVCFCVLPNQGLYSKAGGRCSLWRLNLSVIARHQNASECIKSHNIHVSRNKQTNIFRDLKAGPLWLLWSVFCCIISFLCFLHIFSSLWWAWLWVPVQTLVIHSFVQWIIQCRLVTYSILCSELFSVHSIHSFSHVQWIVEVDCDLQTLLTTTLFVSCY